MQNNTSNPSKKEFVANMFDEIASRYDFANNFLSFGIYKYWRRSLIRKVAANKPAVIIDVATGTGDIAISLAKLNPKKIVGIDNSKEMLNVGIKKVISKGLLELIELQYGDSENIPFDDNTFNACTIAYGVRNFENLDKALSEIYRILRKDSLIVVLEFSTPKNKLFKNLYSWYFKKILPRLGKLITGSNYAYNYLPDSVDKFPNREYFLEHLAKNGFVDNHFQELTFGVACLYVGKKL